MVSYFILATFDIPAFASIGYLILALSQFHSCGQKLVVVIQALAKMSLPGPIYVRRDRLDFSDSRTCACNRHSALGTKDLIAGPFGPRDAFR